MPRRIAITVLLLVSLLTPSASAGDPRVQRGVRDPLRYSDALRDTVKSLADWEIVAMARAVLTGSNMGPGDGWFRPSQSRYDWRWLADRIDADKDGRITREEFKDDPALFSRLDRDRDGAIRADDFDWSDRSRYLQQMGMVSQWMYRIDSSSNGRLSREEWLEFFQRAAKGKDHLTPEDLRDALMPPRPSGPPPKGPSREVLLNGLFNGELGSFFQGPALGDLAPRFELKTHDGKQTIRLADYRGKKPVVLIFGSFT